jgi:hypothetical protein
MAGQVATGPLAASWRGCRLPPLRAGVTANALVEIENAGRVTWRSDVPDPIYLGYHWLDPLGNPLVWGGRFTDLPRPVAPGESVVAELPLAAPMPPGRYRLSIDLVADRRCWFAEVGNRPLELECEVAPRIARRVIAVHVRPRGDHAIEETERLLAEQEEPIGPNDDATVIAFLSAGCLPPPDWSRRLLDAHEKGYGAVAGSVEPVGPWRARRRAASALAPWAPGGGTNPAFAHPLLCPSLDLDVPQPWIEPIEGLPALLPPEDPWLYDGRIQMRVRFDA